jgi:hypothetical protein
VRIILVFEPFYLTCHVRLVEVVLRESLDMRGVASVVDLDGVGSAVRIAASLRRLREREVYCCEHGRCVYSGCEVRLPRAGDGYDYEELCRRCDELVLEVERFSSLHHRLSDPERRYFEDRRAQVRYYRRVLWRVKVCCGHRVCRQYWQDRNWAWLCLVYLRLVTVEESTEELDEKYCARIHAHIEDGRTLLVPGCPACEALDSFCLPVVDDAARRSVIVVSSALLVLLL